MFYWEQYLELSDSAQCKTPDSTLRFCSRNSLCRGARGPTLTPRAQKGCWEPDVHSAFTEMDFWTTCRGRRPRTQETWVTPECGGAPRRRAPLPRSDRKPERVTVCGGGGHMGRHSPGNSAFRPGKLMFVYRTGATVAISPSASSFSHLSVLLWALDSVSLSPSAGAVAGTQGP